MLSADIHSINTLSKSKLNHFFSLLDGWTEDTLKIGIQDGSVHASIRPKSAATEITATLEGAMLIARVKDKENYLQDTLDIVLSRLRA
jgi:4-hydroxy-3-methylbut-2-en-1-yl diphosphate synthase IspG/GcpE